MGKLWRYLETRTELTNKTAVLNAVPGKTEWKARALDLLVAEGYVSEVAGSNRQRLFASVRPYQETPSLSVIGEEDDAA